MTTYYVSNTTPAASDGNFGLTPDLPWLSPKTKINGGTFSPGDIILLKRGDDFSASAGDSANGAIDPLSGSITIGAYGDGPRPILAPNSTTKAGFFINALSNVTIQDIDIRNANQMVTLNNTCQSITVSRCRGYNLGDHAIGTLGTPAGDGHIFQDCDVSYAANDGFNIQGSVGNTTPVIIRRNSFTRIGFLTNNTISGISGSGDAISCHGTCRIDAYDNRIRICAKGGIVHVTTALCRSYRNFISDVVSWGINHTAGSHWIANNIIICKDDIITVSGSIPGCINISGTCTATVYGNTCYVKSATNAYCLANRGNANGTFRNNLCVRDGSGFFTSVDLAGVGTVAFDYNSYAWSATQTTSGEPSLFNATSNKIFSAWKATALPGAATPDTNGSLHTFQIRSVPIANDQNAIPKFGSGAINFANGAVDAGQPDYNLDYFLRARGALPWEAGACEFAAMSGSGLSPNYGGLQVSL